MNKTNRFLLSTFTTLFLVLPLVAQPHRSYEVKRTEFRFASLGKPEELEAVLKDLGDKALDTAFTTIPADGDSIEKSHAFFTFFHSGDWVIGLSVDGPVLEGDALPGGTIEIQFRDTARNATSGGAPHVLRFSLEETPPAPKKRRAPNPAWWLYHLERRFPAVSRSLEVVPLMTFGGGYSSLPGRDHHFIRRPGGGWYFLAKISWQDLYGDWPFTRLGVADTWRVRITRTTSGGTSHVWGGEDGAGRIRWPKMTPDILESFCKSMALAQAIEAYEKEVGRQKDLYMAARRDKHFNHVKTPGPNRHLYDLDTSERFLRAGVGAVEKANANLLKATKPKKKGQHSPLFSQPPAIREKLMTDLDRIFHVDETFEEARRDFLRNELLGRKTEVADAESAAKKKKKSGAEELDAFWNDDGGEQIQLDDLEF